MKLEVALESWPRTRGPVISDEDRSFFVKLGKRISEMRRRQPLTQMELADLLGVSYQTTNSFEHGTRRVPVSMLPRLADVLEVSIEELVSGTAHKTAQKRGPVSKLDQQIEAVRRLPRTKQKFVMDMIDTVLAQVERSSA